jgi:hypothetical protein
MPKEKIPFDRRILRKIDHLIPRLKWSVSPLRIMNWFQNFELKDIESAYELLLAHEHIPLDELQARIDEQLAKIVREIPASFRILIVPYGKLGKSRDLMQYIIAHTPTFEENPRKFILNNDYRSITYGPNTVICLIDDFIGTGNTFIKYYFEGFDGYTPISPWIDTTEITRRFLVAAIIMNDGWEAIVSKTKNGVEILSEKRSKIFDPKMSPLMFFSDVARVQAMNNYYGLHLPGGPRGYDNSESLVSFAHCTPDNTLPVIWGDKNWNPIFARKPQTRMDHARQLKKEVAFYIGVLNKLGLWNDRMHANTSKVKHILIAYIKLRREGIPQEIICQVLGLTLTELKGNLLAGREDGLLDNRDNITTRGELIYQDWLKRIKSANFRRPSKENLKMKDIMYIPRSIGGTT